MNIWMYWENRGPKPAYLNLCLRSIESHCAKHTINLLNSSNINEYLPTLRPEISRFPCIAHKADYIRAQLVYLYGGFWFDADMILLKSLDEINNDLERSGADFIGCGRTHKPSIGFFGARVNCPLLKSWIDDMDRVISASIDYKFKWTELSYQLLWKHSITYNCFQYPFNLCVPYYSNWKQIFFATDPMIKQQYERRLSHDTVMIYLYNAMFPQWFKNMSESEIAGSSYYIADLLRPYL